MQLLSVLRRLRLLVLLLVLLAPACSNAPAVAWPAGVPPRNPAIGNDPITLDVWLAADYVDQPPLRDLARAFEQAYPNIKVQLTGYVWEDMPAKLRLAIGQGTPPDIAHQHAFAMGAQGMAEPLDDLWRQWGEEQSFVPGALEDVTWRGVRYGVPLDINALFMIYNRAAFDAAGLKHPGPGYTFAQLHEDLKRLSSADGARLGIALSASGWDMYGLVRSNGGELLRERDGRSVATLDDPQVVEALRMYSELGWKDKLGSLPPPQPRQSDHPVALFSQHKVAVFFSGPWDLARLKKEASPEVYAEVGTAPLPVSSPTAPGGSVLGGGSLFVPKGAAHRVAAFEFMKWAVSERYALRMASEMGRFPVRSALYAQPALNNDPLLAPFFAQLKTARPYTLEAYAGANAAWSDAVRQAFNPDADVDALLHAAQQRAQQAIDQVQ